MSSSTPTPTPTIPVEVVSTFISTISSIVTATTTQIVYDGDPYLSYQPAFAYSLPIQFLLTGVILSLTTILLIHLVFTAPYHWPMARLNYALQLSGVCSLLLSLGVTLSVILSSVHGTSREWPYMLNYVAVDVPLTNWTKGEEGLWYTLDAVTSGLAHTTHIQFLTYLYPSPIERKLILVLLGPLVLASALSSFLEMSSAATEAIADSVKNICNSALAILFSVALGAWGLLINRKEAWRTDGGTAIFGGGAIALSLFSMALNLYQIAKVPPVWIPSLLWAVVLWQSFLGWWWYIGSDAPEPPTRRPKRKSRHKSSGDTTRLNRVRTRLGLAESGLRRRRNASSDGDENTPTAEANAVSNAATKPKQTGFLDRLPYSLSNWLFRLRVAHRNAAEQQAVENEIKRFEVYGGGVPGAGWGLGSYATATRGAQYAPSTTTGTGTSIAEEGIARSGRLRDERDDDESGHVSIPMRPMSHHATSSQEYEDVVVETPVAGTSTAMENRRVVWEDEDDLPEREQDGGGGAGGGGGGRREASDGKRKDGRGKVDRDQLSSSQGWSWFGPLGRWRLRDASSYS